MSAGLAGRLGRTVSPWLALALELSESSASEMQFLDGFDDDEYDDEILQHGLGLLLHMCAAPNLWLRSGIAVSRAVIYDRDGRSVQDTGLAVSVALGVLVSRRVELSVRFERAHFDPQGSFIPFHTWLVIGVNWN